MPHIVDSQQQMAEGTPHSTTYHTNENHHCQAIHMWQYSCPVCVITLCTCLQHAVDHQQQHAEGNPNMPHPTPMRNVLPTHSNMWAVQLSMHNPNQIVIKPKPVHAVLPKLECANSIAAESNHSVAHSCKLSL